MGVVPLGHMYKIQIDFENPSLLMLAIGESEFTISADGKNIGDGKLDPFYLVALGEGTAYGEYIVYEDADDVSAFDLYGTSLDIPFVYYLMPR